MQLISCSQGACFTSSSYLGTHGAQVGEEKLLKVKSAEGCPVKLILENSFTGTWGMTVAMDVHQK